MLRKEIDMLIESISEEIRSTQLRMDEERDQRKERETGQYKEEKEGSLVILLDADDSN